MIPHSGHRIRSWAWFVALTVLSCVGEQWVDFRSEEGGFMATFPGTPTQQVKTVNTAQGPRDMHMYSFTDKQTSFSVVISELPHEQIGNVGPAATLDSARDGAVANTQGKLLSELIIDVSGHPGRELKIAAAGGKGTIRARLFLVENRLYQALVVTPADESYAPRVRRFLESVKLL